MILYQNGYFYLNTENSSYIIRILPDKTLNHCYYGKKIPSDNMDYYNLFIGHDLTAPLVVGEKITTFDALPQEYPTFGRGDYRSPAICIANAQGRGVNDLKYCSHRILTGKPRIKGLPQLDRNTDDVQTLEILLRDIISGAEVVLSYTTFDKEDVIARHAEVCNNTNDTVRIDHIVSASVDFESSDFDLVSLQGAWVRERSVERCPLHHGKTVISSTFGSSGHSANPFVAIADRTATEDVGNVYGFALIYSGDFSITVQKSQFGSTRVQLGMNREVFSWKLEHGESFVTPETIMVYSADGLGGMSHCFHSVCRNHLGRCADRSIKHPIVLNLWEAMYFDSTEEKIKQLINECNGLGIDTLVMDDGWFGERNSDDSSLGDWFVNKNKFPGGFDPIIDACRKNGMRFGLWLEPEMISENSHLFRQHPDWYIHIPGVEPVKSRNQLTLDLSLPEVVDGIYQIISALLNQYDISYVKWDMNRNITDNGSNFLPAECQPEHSHRYMLGVYLLMQRLTAVFPNIFFEGSSGGGGRFDFGILYYMPQIWTSDNTDPIERLKIQYGTSLVYPLETMSAHVSACPNHQTGRTTPFETRSDVAQVCSFGYELNICELSAAEKELIKEQVKKHNEIEEYFGNGRFYRLHDPFMEKICAWEVVAEDQAKAMAVIVFKELQPNPNGLYLKLKGLDPQRRYMVDQLNTIISGQTLMEAGIPVIQPKSDYASMVLDLVEI